MKKLNCWEFKKCGRQFGGEKVSDLGLCPVVIEIALEGLTMGNLRQSLLGIRGDHM